MIAGDWLARLSERAPLRIHTYTAINIVGLAVGLCAALFIALMIRIETSYDRFLPDYERVFRVSMISQPLGQRAASLDGTSPDIAGWLRTEFASIEAIG